MAERIEIKSLSKNYKSHRVIENMNVTFPGGKIIGRFKHIEGNFRSLAGNRGKTVFSALFAGGYDERHVFVEFGYGGIGFRER